MSSASPLGFHLILRASDDRVLAPDAPARRTLADVVLRAGRARGLLAFGGADTHLHVLMVGSRATATALTRAITLSLRRRLRLPVPFEPTRIRPVADQGHLARAFRYVQRNAAHHGIADPAATEATSLHDLLGLRTGSTWLADRVRQHLPRVGRVELVELMGMPELALAPETGSGPAWVDAAAAVRLVARLDRRTPACTAARAALVDVALNTTRPEALADWLEVDRRSIRRLVGTSAPADRAALTRQLAWREAVVRHPPPPA